jgi:long-chain fatty acid transport protein
MTHDIGFRATIGTRMKLSEHTMLGAYVQTEQPHEYDNLHVTSMHGTSPFFLLSKYGSGATVDCNGDSGSVCRQDVIVEQPMNIGVGFAHTSMDGNLLFAFDFTHKAWSEAKFFNEFYQDQEVYSVGLQLTQGNIKWRVGYGYADDPLLDVVQEGKHLATIGGVNTSGETYTSPMYGLFMSYFQAMETPVIYKHRVSVGVGIEGFLAPMLTLDAHVAFQLEEDKCFGANQSNMTPVYDSGTGTQGISLGGTDMSTKGCGSTDHTKATVSSFHLGGSLTWKF